MWRLLQRLDKRGGACAREAVRVRAPVGLPARLTHQARAPGKETQSQNCASFLPLALFLDCVVSFLLISSP